MHKQAWEKHDLSTAKARGLVVKNLQRYSTNLRLTINDLTAIIEALPTNECGSSCHEGEQQWLVEGLMAQLEECNQHLSNAALIMRSYERRERVFKNAAAIYSVAFQTLRCND